MKDINMKNKWEKISSHWQQFALEAQKTWSELTDEELVHINGSRNTLASIVQRRYYVSRKEAHEQIETWIETLKI
jgi:uncharacterized protein YjbJ (UPF0337 family)